MLQHSKQFVLADSSQGPDDRCDDVMRPVAGAGGREAEVTEDGGRVGVRAGHSEAGLGMYLDQIFLLTNFFYIVFSHLADLAHVAGHVVGGGAANGDSCII